MKTDGIKQIEHETVADAAARKQSHLDLALESQGTSLDERFYYEPMLSEHPVQHESFPSKFGKQQMRFPIWISSMTGGSTDAGPINKMLAKTAAKFGLGIGLGSCRIILEDNTYFEDFNLRPILGDRVPFYANIGIAQVERVLAQNSSALLKSLVSKLDADGLIVHVNPLQEWLQKEGDRITQPPLVTIEQLLNEVDFPIVVKEVGQGFGPESMRALLKMPLLALDFAASGGTNFAKLEMIRNAEVRDFYKNLETLGHTAEEMVAYLNDAIADLGDTRKCESVIISGGIKNFLDGYYCISKANMDAVYGQAAPFLKHAYKSQEALDAFADAQTRGLVLAKHYLRIKNKNG